MRSGFPKINREELSEYSAPIPTKSEQDRLADVLLVYDKRELVEEDHLAKLKLLKNGLMEDLLTGRVRVVAEVKG